MKLFSSKSLRDFLRAEAGESRMLSIKSLLLHKNLLAKWQDVECAASPQNLEWLTLYGNPITSQPEYQARCFSFVRSDVCQHFCSFASPDACPQHSDHFGGPGPARSDGRRALGFRLRTAEAVGRHRKLPALRGQQRGETAQMVNLSHFLRKKIAKMCQTTLQAPGKCDPLPRKAT